MTRKDDTMSYIDDNEVYESIGKFCEDCELPYDLCECDYEEKDTCDCTICPCSKDVMSFGDVCMLCSTGEHLG